MKCKDDPLKFLTMLCSMPKNFVPSFTTEQWVVQKENQPSSVFKAAIDPKTMIWRDQRPQNVENFDQQKLKQGFKPNQGPIDTFVGAQITLKEAEGVPLPQSSKSFKEDDIVKRAVRFIVEKKSMYSSNFIGNSV